MQPTCDLEMQHDPQIAIQPNCDLFAKSSNLANRLAVGGAQRRIGRAQQKRRLDQHPDQVVPNYTGRDSFDVNSDIRQFGHRSFPGGAVAVLDLA